MFGKNLLASLLIGACFACAGALAAQDAAESDASSGMKSMGDELHLDAFFSWGEVEQTPKNGVGTLDTLRSVFGIEVGRRNPKGFGWGGSIRYQTNEIGNANPAETSGIGFGGFLTYSKDMWGARELDRWVFGLRGKAGLDYSYESEKDSQNGTNDVSYNDFTLRPEFAGFASFDTGKYNFEFHGGVYLDYALLRELKQVPTNGTGGTKTELEADSPLGFFVGGAWIFDRYRVSGELYLLNEVGFRIGFAWLF